MTDQKTFKLDGKTIAFEDGDTIMDAAFRAGEYIPHLCHNPEFTPHGSCRVCVVEVDGRQVSACTQPAVEGMEVDNSSDAIMENRRNLLQMLFVEGNHVCPGCEKSGACQLQAVAYYTGMLAPHFTHFFPQRELDASHPDFLIDFNRCILCELCVRASCEVDGKDVFMASKIVIDPLFEFKVRMSSNGMPFWLMRSWAWPPNMPKTFWAPWWANKNPATIRRRA